MSQQDMAYIEGKKLTRDEILGVFKVPKAVLGIGD
jgi:phage portal protein BeeE